MNIIFKKNTPENIIETIIQDWEKQRLFFEIEKFSNLCKKELVTGNEDVNNKEWYFNNVLPLFLNILKAETPEEYINFLTTFFSVEKEEIFEKAKYKVDILILLSTHNN